MQTVLAVVPYYLPYPGGAEKSMHEMLSRLVPLGFASEALVPLLPSHDAPLGAPMVDVMDGVTVRRLPEQQWLREVAERARQADLVFFSLAHIFRRHFDAAVDRIMDACRSRVIYFCRGSEVTDYFPGAVVVANSKAVGDRLPQRTGVRIRILRPLVSHPKPRPELPRRFVTIINPSELKGGHILLHLARSFPDVPFLAQLGRSEPVMGLGQLPNITVSPPEPDLSLVYAQTTVLVVPSKDEPFGRVALEGALGGCRLLLHRASGLREVPVPDFCFVDGLDPDVWAHRLSELLTADPKTQAEMSASIRDMAGTYDPGWHQFLEEMQLLTSDESGDECNEPAVLDTAHVDARRTIRRIEDLFAIHIPSTLQRYSLDNQPGAWRCKLVVSGADTGTWIIETNRGKSQLIRGDGHADATVTVSANDLMALARGATTVDYLRSIPDRLSVSGDFDVAARLARLFQ
jgi:glycosyltransferase involved in cell wall biosynthesis